MKDIVTGRTPRLIAGVCGWPIHHSLSPVIHKFWLEKSRTPGTYVPFAVHPSEAIRAFKSLPRTPIRGVNVTLPLKRMAFEAADHVSQDAQTIGVANCLYVKDSQLHAHNTDIDGFLSPLLKHVGAETLTRSSALIVGTGGAARAVIGALLKANCPEIYVCGRHREKADILLNVFSIPSLHVLDWEKRHQHVSRMDIIINATSAGMAGKPALDINLEQAVKNQSFVYDLVYTPKMTPLLAQAQTLGLAHIGGLDMLIEQARPAFELFYGVAAQDDWDPARRLQRALTQA